MEIVTHLTVENRVKFQREDAIKVEDPSKWLWAFINNVWQPLFEVK